MVRLMTTFHLERSRYDIRHFYEWLGYKWGDHIQEWLDLNRKYDLIKKRQNNGIDANRFT